MACTVCCGEDFVDHGFQEPDIREKYHAWSKDAGKTNEYGDLEPIVVTVTIRREWGKCECGSEEYAIANCYYKVKGTDDKSLLLTNKANIYESVKKMYPDHNIESQDIWDGEEHLRRMEMGLY